ncbi:MAG: amidohydrolase family protein, partial [Actinomycetota bacterium]
EVGMSPMDAIVASTRVAAENLGIGSSTGTVEPGKSADLIALGSDPLADIKVFGEPANVTGVWLGGERVKG